MSSPHSPPAFSRSLKVFKSQLSIRDAKAFEVETLNDLRIAVEGVQREQAHRRGYRNLNKIKPLVDFLHQYARVIEQFVSAKPDFLAFIWRLTCHVRVASQVTDAFDALLDAYARIGESLPLLAAVEDLFSHRSHEEVEQILANVYEDILKFHSRAIRFFQQRSICPFKLLRRTLIVVAAWRIAFKTAFRAFDDMYGDVVKNLARSKELLIQTASVQHFQDAQEARLRNFQRFDDQLYRDEQHRKSFVIDWLSHISCDDWHKQLCQDLSSFPKSTHWIFSQTQVSEWLLGSESCSPILWILGIPGAGKTFIFSSIVEEIKAKLPGDHVIYFYCKYNDPQKSTTDSMVRCLIAQVLALNPACVHYLYDVVIGSVNRTTNSTNTLCIELFTTIALYHEQLFIGIDGLDECQESERQQMLSMIHNILKATKANRNVRVFLTSRKERDIGNSLRFASRLEIRPHHLDKDIQHYVQRRVLDLGRKFELSIEHQKPIIADIAGRSRGMFLLARLIMDNLMDQDCREDLKEELSDRLLPNGIEEAYARILVRMQKNDKARKRWDRAKLSLDVIVMATRPLKVHEIQGVLSIRLEDNSIDFENRRTVSSIEEFLGPMVEVHVDGSVNLIHSSAKDYLIQRHSGFYVDKVAAAARLALLCSSYLTFPCFEPHMGESEIMKAVHRGDYAFQEYATLNWTHHGRAATDISSLRHPISLLHQRHFEPHVPNRSDSNFGIDSHDVPAALEDCQKAYDRVDSICVDENDQKPIPFPLRRVFEVRAILEKMSPHMIKESPLLREAYGNSWYKCSVIQCGRFYRGFASRGLRDEHLKGHQCAHNCTVEGCEFMLIGFPTTLDLARHAQLYHCEPNEEFVFPSVKRASIAQILRHAIDRDDALAVRDICTEITAYPTEETDFLYRAVKGRRYSAAQALLEYLGSDHQIHHKAKDLRTVLHEAVLVTQLDLLKGILRTHVDVNAQDSHQRTPLSEALEHGRHDAANLLIGHPNIILKPPGRRCIGSYRKGFLGASSGGYNLIVQAIFDSVVGTSEVDFGQSSRLISQALTKAALHNNESMVNLILKLGHDMGVEHRYSKTLKKVVSGGMEAMRLLEYPEVDENGKTRGNSLAFAAQKGDIAKVSRLLEDGANVNYVSEMDYNPLVAASQFGRYPMVRLLIDKGADVNIWISEYGDPLRAALSEGHMQVVQLLLDMGADVNGEVEPCGSALQVASSRVPDETLVQVVQMLLNRGADVNAQGGYYGNALQAASLRGSPQAVQILLEKGADINAQGGQYGNALQAASKQGHYKLVQLLLEKGADINAQGGRYGNALQAASLSESPQVVQILLEKGAEINAQGGQYGNALQAASASLTDDAQVVQMLLEKGADINAQGGQYGNALLAASASLTDDAQKVQMLLEKGADINAQGGTFGSALEAALFYKNLKVVRLLLESGADVNTVSERHSSALQAVLDNANVR